MSIQNKNILVLTSCSFKKKHVKSAIKAKELYEGDFFKKVKNFASLNNFDLKIISAKYGLVDSNDSISYYDLQIRKKSDIENLRKIVIPKMEKIIPLYDKILVIMGENYKKIVMSPSDKFLFFYDNRGLGGYKALMNDLLRLNKKNLYKLLFYQDTKQIDINYIKKFKFKFKKLTDY